MENSVFGSLEESSPTVAKYLMSIPSSRLIWGGDKSNSLAGLLDLGQNDTYLNQEGPVIEYAAQDVWHFSDWSYLAAFIKEHFQAVRVVTASEEEGCGSLEMLQLYDWEGLLRSLVDSARLKAATVVRLSVWKP
jgi:hypothetical protein